MSAVIPAQPAMSDQVRHALEPFGFSETESLVYAELVQRPRQTGYAIAKAVRKGQPSIYAALAGLEQKKAVFAEPGQTRQFVAVPPVELLDLLEEQFAARRREAEGALGRLKAAPVSGAIQPLTTADEVYARARSLIRSATETLLVELFPEPLERLRPELEAAAGRKGGPTIAGLIMRPTAPIGAARLTVSPVGDKIIDLHAGHLTHVVADGRRAVLAAIDHDGTAQALSIDDRFLSTVLHNALTSDVLVHRAANSDWRGPNFDLFGRHPPGLRDEINDLMSGLKG